MTMNRKFVVSVLAMILVITMVLSLVLTVIPAGAEGLECDETVGTAYTQQLGEEQ